MIYKSDTKTQKGGNYKLIKYFNKINNTTDINKIQFYNQKFKYYLFTI